jgi:hypothetical protein
MLLARNTNTVPTTEVGDFCLSHKMTLRENFGCYTTHAHPLLVVEFSKIRICYVAVKIQIVPQLGPRVGRRIAVSGAPRRMRNLVAIAWLRSFAQDVRPFLTEIRQKEEAKFRSGLRHRGRKWEAETIKIRRVNWLTPDVRLEVIMAVNMKTAILGDMTCWVVW